VNTRTLGALGFCVVLLIFSSSARAAGPTKFTGPSDYNDFTLDPPPEKGGKFTVRQAVSLTEKWDKHGVVRIAVISDHNQGYELWSGVELIDVKTEKLFNVNAVRCFVSFCVYVGKVPPGRYFINHLYADSYAPTQVAAPIRRSSAPIRNLLGSFEVKVHSLTDLGMVGIFRGVEASNDDTFETSFLGYFSDLALIFDETYRGFQKKYFGLTGPEQRWDAGEWETSAVSQAVAARRFFADFSQSHAAANGLYFPTVMGAIYSLDWAHGFSRGDVGTLFMLTALSMSGDRWIAGTEAGRLYLSQDRGARWTAADAFPRDEVVVHVFERNGALHALTLSQQQSAAKLYRATAGTSFTEIARTRFALENKARMPRLLVELAGGRQSLTQLYLNRLDLKKVRVLESADFLTLQLNSRHFASFNFTVYGWQSYDSEQQVQWATANGDGVFLMSQRPADNPQTPITRILQLGPGLGGQRGQHELQAAPRGGIHVRDDGSKLAVLSIFDAASNGGKSAEPQIYALIGDAKPAAVRALDDVAFFYDSELRVVDDALVLIDRVAPRVHRFVESRAITYSLYDP